MKKILVLMIALVIGSSVFAGTMIEADYANNKYATLVYYDGSKEDIIRLIDNSFTGDCTMEINDANITGYLLDGITDFALKYQSTYKYIGEFIAGSYNGNVLIMVMAYAPGFNTGDGWDVFYQTIAEKGYIINGDLTAYNI